MKDYLKEHIDFLIFRLNFLKELKNDIDRTDIFYVVTIVQIFEIKNEIDMLKEILNKKK